MMRWLCAIFLILLVAVHHASATGGTFVVEEDIGHINAQRFGPTPTDTTEATLLAAVANAATVNKFIYLTPGAWTVGQDVIIPSTRGLYLPTGTTVTIASGKTLTILGPLRVDGG